MLSISERLHMHLELNTLLHVHAYILDQIARNKVRNACVNNACMPNVEALYGGHYTQARPYCLLCRFLSRVSHFIFFSPL